MKRYIKSARRAWPYGTQYEVHWISPDGKDCLLGGSNSVQVANAIAQQQAYSLLTNPFESNDRKLKFLENLYVVDVDTEEDITTADTQDRIDEIMSEIDSRIRR